MLARPRRLEEPVEDPARLEEEGPVRIGQGGDDLARVACAPLAHLRGEAVLLRDADDPWVALLV